MRFTLRRWMWGSTGCGVILAGAVFVLRGSAVQADLATAPTFTKDVAPIFQQKCETCHRPAGMGPMSLITYEDARPWVKAIAQRVSTRQMPPWNIDKTVGIQKFKNDRSLSDDQLATILAWIDNGAPKGDPNDMPPAITWPSDQGWQMQAKYGPPDLTVKSPPWTVPAEAQDAWWRPKCRPG